jgi:hypothetical protein
VNAIVYKGLALFDKCLTPCVGQKIVCLWDVLCLANDDTRDQTDRLVYGSESD